MTVDPISIIGSISVADAPTLVTIRMKLKLAENAQIAENAMELRYRNGNGRPAIIIVGNNAVSVRGGGSDEQSEIIIRDMTIKRFATSHDCEGSSGYTVSFGNIKTAVCTDTGILTDEIRQNLEGCRLVMLESNHDPVMLRLGPYTPELKVRIGSEKGHLANADCAAEIKRLYNLGTTHFVLAHLSENNNTPEKASSATRAALMDLGAKINEDYILYVAPEEGGKVISL